MHSRRVARTSLIYHLRVFDTAGDVLIGHLVDLTLEGMLLIGERPIPVGRRLTVRMDLPRNVMADRGVTFRVESRWCRQDENGEFFAMGFQISDIPAEAMTAVRRLITDFFRDTGEDDPAADMNPPL